MPHHQGGHPIQNLALHACRIRRRQHQRHCPNNTSVSKEKHRGFQLLEQQKNLQWVGPATGYPLDTRLLHGHMGVNPTWQSATVYGSGDVVFPASSTAFVGKAVAALIDRWDHFTNNYICLAGLSISLNQFLNKLREEDGKDWSVVYVEFEKCAEEAEKRMAGEWQDAGMFLMERSLLSDDRAAIYLGDGKALRGRMNVEYEDLGEVLREVLHGLEHRSVRCGCG